MTELHDDGDTVTEHGHEAAPKPDADHPRPVGALRPAVDLGRIRL